MRRRKQQFSAPLRFGKRAYRDCPALPAVRAGGAFLPGPHAALISIRTYDSLRNPERMKDSAASRHVIPI
jgi:hypothetical protein